MATRAADVLGIRYPITQGGLAHLAFAELAAAVSNAGGLGQITASTLESADVLREQIAKVQALTRLPFAVNFQLGRRDLSEMVLTAAEM
ncbi:MAG: nitronate monooxygenase, partial [Chloroflexi bacterium]|nr:nitronate monooxygenase [Chloroflexota bacterium]